MDTLDGLFGKLFISNSNSLCMDPCYDIGGIYAAIGVKYYDHIGPNTCLCSHALGFLFLAQFKWHEYHFP